MREKLLDKLEKQTVSRKVYLVFSYNTDEGEVVGQTV